MATIKGSVGKKGKNLPDDVKLVQSLLNAFVRMASFAKLKVDGIVGPKTEGAIQIFQKDVLTRKSILGRIDPKGEVFRVLQMGPQKYEKQKEKDGGPDEAELIKIGEKLIAVPIRGAEKVLKTLDKLGQQMWKLVQIPLKFVKTILGYVRQLAAFVADKVIKAAMKALNYIVSYLKKLMSIIKDMLATVKNLLSAIAKGAWAFAKNLLTHLKAGMVEYAKNVLAILKELGPIETALDLLAKAKKLAGSIVPALKDALKAMADIKTLKTLLNTAKAQAQEALSIAEEAARNAIDLEKRSAG